MTATTTPIGADRVGSVGVARLWRGLAWSAWRQHRTALLWIFGALALAAVIMAATGPVLHGLPAVRRFGLLLNVSESRPVQASLEAVLALLGLAPVLVGVFLGAPLLAAEAEHGTTKIAWTQGIGRQKWFIAQVIPVLVLLALVGVALGYEWRWWAQPLGFNSWNWLVFTLNPLPLAGWLAGGFGIGVLLGAAIRRTVAAMAATAASCLALIFTVANFWRPYYLPPLHKVTSAAAGGYSIFSPLSSAHGPGPIFVSSVFRWPDGRPLSNLELDRSNSWLLAHHIRLWMYYQPASRYGLFELIELGWLIALAVIGIGAAMAMIRRRAA